jgi:hypothetical protein
VPFVVCKIFGNVTCPVWVPLWPRVLCLLHNSYQYNSGGSEEIVEDTKENSFFFVEISNLYAFPDIHQTRMKLRIRMPRYRRRLSPATVSTRRDQIELANRSFIEKMDQEKMHL